MGRIAEALKKAQHEREQRLGVSGRGLAACAQMDADVVAQDRVVRPTSAPARAGSGLRRPGRFQGAGPAFRAETHRAVSPPAIQPLPVWDVDPTLVVVKERSSSVAEQYRAARTWLLRRNPAGTNLCLAVTSSMSREGKSVTTANLAVIAAEIRHLKVLVVDGDFRQGSMAKLFRIRNVPGLADVLAGRARLDDTIVQTPLSNLQVLPAGTCQGVNPTELLNSPMAARVFEEIRERQHFVLVDTPPVQKLSDVGVIGSLCGGILMVVRMHKTPAHLVRQSLHWLQSNKLEVVGCIATGCNLTDARHLYNDSYDDDE